MKPFITLGDMRVMIASIVSYYPSGVGGTKMDLVDGPSNATILQTPAEIDALILEACGDVVAHQPATHEPQAASPRTDEPQDPAARLRQWRGHNRTRKWVLRELETMNEFLCEVLCGGTWLTGFSDTDPDEAVTIALAAAKEAGHG